MKHSEYNCYTAIQQRMINVLRDGLPHTAQELHACLNDDLGPLANIRAHLAKLRRILRSRGEDIICEYKERKGWYRHVRLLVAPSSIVNEEPTKSESYTS